MEFHLATIQITLATTLEHAKRHSEHFSNFIPVPWSFVLAIVFIKCKKVV